MGIPGPHKNRYFRRRNDCTRLNDRPGKGNFIFSRSAAAPFLFLHSLPSRFSLSAHSFPLFPPPLLTQSSYLQRQITPFATVISLRLCSFADTPVSLFYSEGFVRIFLPFSPSLSYARHVFPSSRNLFVSRPSLPSSPSPVYTYVYICIHARVYACISQLSSETILFFSFLGTRTETVSLSREIRPRYSTSPPPPEIERFVV